MPTVSEDPYVKALIKEHKIDVVLSSGSITALINNMPPFYEPWEIPVTVIQNDTSSSGIYQI